MDPIYKVLLLADSRGYSVKGFMNTFLEGKSIPLLVEVLAFSGATIEEVVSRGLADARFKHYDQVYLLAGVNNLTKFHRRRQVSPQYYDWTTLVNQLMVKFYSARTDLKPLSANIIVCDLIALHMETYNEGKAAFYKQQEIIDNATIRVNEYIQEMNGNEWVYSPRFADHVHKARSVDKPIQHRYSATMKDGLHYNPATTAKFSILLLRNILSLRADLQNYGS